jgi:hypothetical protein
MCSFVNFQTLKILEEFELHSEFEKIKNQKIEDLNFDKIQSGMSGFYSSLVSGFSMVELLQAERFADRQLRIEGRAEVARALLQAYTDIFTAAKYQCAALHSPDQIAALLDL